MGDRYDSADAALERDLIREEPDDEDEFFDDDLGDDDWDFDTEREVWW